MKGCCRDCVPRRLARKDAGTHAAQYSLIKEHTLNAIGIPKMKANSLIKGIGSLGLLPPCFWEARNRLFNVPNQRASLP